MPPIQPPAHGSSADVIARTDELLLRTGRENDRKLVGLGSLDAGLHRDDDIAVLEPHRPPDRWTHFKAALFNVPLLGRLASIRTARGQVNAAGNSLAGLRYQAENFRGTFVAALTAEFGEDIARHAIDTVVPKPLQQSGAGFTARRVRQILAFARFAPTAQAAASAPALQQSAAHTGPVSIALAHMQAMANQPDYFRARLTPQQCAAATELIGQLQERGIDLQQLAGIVADYGSRLQAAPAWQKQQIAAAGIQACIREANTITLRAHLADSSAGGGTDAASSSSQPVLRTATGPTALELLCMDALEHQSKHQSQVLWAEDVHDLVAWQRQSLSALRRVLLDELPVDFPAHRLDRALTDVEIGMTHTSLNLEQLRDLVRGRIVINELKHQFYPDWGDATLRNIVREEAAQLGVDENTATAAAERVEEHIAKAFSAIEYEGTRNGVAALLPFTVLRNNENGESCPDQLPAVLRRLHDRFDEDIRIATRSFLQAPATVQAEEHLSSARKAVLLDYLGKHAVDPDPVHWPPLHLDQPQLQQLATVADCIAAELPQLQAAAEGHDPAGLFDGMERIHAAFTGNTVGFPGIARPGKTPSPLDARREQEIFDLCTRLALADGGERPPAPAGRLRVGDTVRQFRDACAQSSSAVAKLGALYDSLLRLTDASLPAGPPLPLSQMPPELLVRTLCHPGLREEGVLDARDMKVGGEAQQHLQAQFEPTAQLSKWGFDIRNFEGAVPASADAVRDRLSAGIVIVNGRRMAGRSQGDGNADPVAAIHQEYSDQGAPGIANAVVSRMFRNNSAMKWFRDTFLLQNMNDPPRPRAGSDVPPALAHEVWQENGVWYVRSTLVEAPDTRDGDPASSKGAVLFTTTQSIHRDNNFRLLTEPVETRVVFAY